MEREGTPAGRPAKRKRAANYSEDELMTMIFEASKMKRMLLGSLTNEVTAKTKENAWELVTEAVNNVSRVQRCPSEVRNKFRDFRSEIKNKAAKMKRERNKTGGGPKVPGDIKPAEEAMLGFLEVEAIEGVEGILDSEDVDSSQDVFLPSTCLPSTCLPSTSNQGHPSIITADSQATPSTPARQCPTPHTPTGKIPRCASNEQTLTAQFTDENGMSTMCEVIVDNDSSQSKTDHQYSRRECSPLATRAGNGRVSGSTSQPASGQSSSRGRTGTQGSHSSNVSAASPQNDMQLMSQMLSVQKQICDVFTDVRDYLQDISSSLQILANAAQH